MTDPSFAGQILNLTYPMIGNYGIPGKEMDEYGLYKHFESHRIWSEALLISDYSHSHSHWNAAQSLSDWMKEYDVPGLYVFGVFLLLPRPYINSHHTTQLL